MSENTETQSPAKIPPSPEALKQLKQRALDLANKEDKKSNASDSESDVSETEADKEANAKAAQEAQAYKAKLKDIRSAQAQAAQAAQAAFKAFQEQRAINVVEAAKQNTLGAERVAAIKTVLKKHYKDVEYNYDKMSTAVDILSRTGVNSLFATTILVGELLRKEDQTIPYTKFPSHIAPLLVKLKSNKNFKRRNSAEAVTPTIYRLLSRDEISKKLRDDNAYNFCNCWNAFQKKVQKLTNVDTTIRYITNFLTMVQWYLDCGFFSDETIVVKKGVRGCLGKNYFLDPKDGPDGDSQFNIFQHWVTSYLGKTALRDLAKNGVDLISSLNKGYLLSISKQSRTREGVLVLGMRNFLSKGAIEQLNSMTVSLNPETHTTEVFTVGSDRSKSPVTDDENRKHILARNLYLRWDSSCFLAKVVKKFVGVKFKTIYLDHNTIPAMWENQDSTLTELYDVTIPLLRNGKLLSDDCKVILPFNYKTIFYLHKSWGEVKKYARVTFLSDLNDNLWYKSMGTVANAESAGHQLNKSKEDLIEDLHRLLDSEVRSMNEETRKKKRKRDVTDSPLIQRLEKNLERWERYRDDEITNLKWIQIEMSDKSEREFAWPRGGTYVVDESTRPNVVLTCNVTEADFKRYGDVGVLSPNITIKFGGNSSMKVQRIITGGETVIDITANTSSSINTDNDGSGNAGDDDDSDGC